jgi:hypothetical protein
VEARLDFRQARLDFRLALGSNNKVFVFFPGEEDQ